MIVHFLSSCNNLRIRKIVYKEVFHLETDISIGGTWSFISYLSEFYHKCLKPSFVSIHFSSKKPDFFLLSFFKVHLGGFSSPGFVKFFFGHCLCFHSFFRAMCFQFVQPLKTMNHSKKTPNSRDEPVMCLPITRKHLIVLSDTLLLGSCHKSTSFLSTSLVEYTNIMPKLIQLLFSKGSLNSLCERLIVKKPLFRNRSREKRLKCGTLHKSWTENKQQQYLWSDDLNPKFQIWVYHSVCAEEFSKEG